MRSELCVHVQGPIQNLEDHLADPFAVNGFTIGAQKFVPGG
jgi:hypothetical protein